MLVRPPQMMPMFFPSSRRTLTFPCWKSFAHRRQDDDRDHAPEDAEHREEAAQLVRAQVLEGLNERFAHQPGSSSLSPGLRPSRTSILVPLPTPTLIGVFLRPFGAPARNDVHEGLLLRVVGDRGLGYEQRVCVLLEHDLGVRRHVGLQLLARIVDRHLHFEARDVVLLDAERARSASRGR